jgi:hypothetical protein
MQVATLEDDGSQAELLAVASNSLAIIRTFLRTVQSFRKRYSANFELTTPAASLRLCLPELTGSGRALLVRTRDYQRAKRDQGPPTPGVRYDQTDLAGIVCNDSDAPQRPAHYSKPRSRFVLNHACPMTCLSGRIERALERCHLCGEQWNAV